MTYAYRCIHHVDLYMVTMDTTNLSCAMITMLLRDNLPLGGGGGGGWNGGTLISDILGGVISDIQFFWVRYLIFDFLGGLISNI